MPGSHSVCSLPFKSYFTLLGKENLNKIYEHSHWLGKKNWIAKFICKNFYALTHAEGNECTDELHKSSEGPGNIAPMFGWKDKAMEPASTA